MPGSTWGKLKRYAEASKSGRLPCLLIQAGLSGVQTIWYVSAPLHLPVVETFVVKEEQFLRMKIQNPEK